MQVLHAAGFALGIIHKEHFRYASHSPTAPLVCLALTAPIHLRQDDEGSPARAPELLFDDGVSTPFGASDVWCLGVLLFTLIRGFSPFEEDNEVRMMRRIRGAKVDYEGWEATPEALDLVKRMLVADPNERATVAEVLSHEWITRNRDEQAAALLHGTVERLAKLDVRRRMRCVALRAAHLANDVAGLHHLPAVLQRGGQRDSFCAEDRVRLIGCRYGIRGRCRGGLVRGNSA